MAHLSSSLAALRVIGDDLVPDEITVLLGCPPTKSQMKGEIIRGTVTGRERTVKTGMWRLIATDCTPENLDSQVKELLSKLTPDLNVWAKIKERFEIDLFCGLFMEETNEGAVVAAETMRLLGERGIDISLDIYAPSRDIKEDDPCPCGSGKSYGSCCGSNEQSGSAA